MPAKKLTANKAERTKKKTLKTRLSVDITKKQKEEKIKAEIKEAVEKIPEFLFSKMETPLPIDEIKAENQRPEKPTWLPPPAAPKKTLPANYQFYRTRRLLLWLGVSVLTAAIFSMWIWNLSSFWQDAGKKSSTENGLRQEANELQAVLEESQTKETIKQQLETELTKSKVKNALGQAMAGYLTMTTTSTE